MAEPLSLKVTGEDGTFTSSDNQIICTNHYQSDTFRNDERNQENIATSDSPYRFARLQELLKENKPIDPMKAASILRNQKDWTILIWAWVMKWLLINS